MRLDNVTKKIKNKKVPVFNVEFPEYGLVLFKGEIGTYKSTLLNIIGGIDKQYLGKIDPAFKGQCSSAFQSFHLIEQQTVKENILLQANIKNLDVNELMHEYLALFEIEEYKETKVANLSAGQRSRVSLITALICQSPVLLVDEPTANLDTRNSIKIMNIISDYAKNHLVLLVSHDQELCVKYADYIFMVKTCQLIENDLKKETPTVFLTTKNLVSAKRALKKTQIIDQCLRLWPSRTVIKRMLGIFLLTFLICLYAYVNTTHLIKREEEFASIDVYYERLIMNAYSPYANDTLVGGRLSDITFVGTDAVLLSGAVSYIYHDNIELLVGRKPRADHEVVVSQGLYDLAILMSGGFYDLGIRNASQLINERIIINDLTGYNLIIVGVSVDHHSGIYYNNQNTYFQINFNAVDLYTDDDNNLCLRFNNYHTSKQVTIWGKEWRYQLNFDPFAEIEFILLESDYPELFAANFDEVRISVNPGSKPINQQIYDRSNSVMRLTNIRHEDTEAILEADFYNTEIFDVKLLIVIAISVFTIIVSIICCLPLLKLKVNVFRLRIYQINPFLILLRIIYKCSVEFLVPLAVGIVMLFLVSNTPYLLLMENLYYFVLIFMVYLLSVILQMSYVFYNPIKLVK